MDDEPGTSNETSNELHANKEQQQQWTKELKLIPQFTYELLQEHLGTNLHSAKDGTTGAQGLRKSPSMAACCQEILFISQEIFEGQKNPKRNRNIITFKTTVRYDGMYLK